MRDAHGRVRRVHALPALAAGAVHVDLEIALVDLHVDLLGLGQHRHRRGRGVDAALRLGGRDALHAVHAGLELQLAVRALAGDAEDDLLEAALLRLALRHDLQLPAMPLRVAGIHAEEIEGEQRSLLPALTGTDRDDDVLLVERIAGDEQHTQLPEQLLHALRRVRQILPRDVPQIGVIGLDERARFLDLSLGGAQRAYRVHDGLQGGQLAADFAYPLVARGRRRIGHEPAELVVALLDLRQTAPETGREGLAHAAASLSRSPASASSSDAAATSIIPRSGRRVVMRWRSSPGTTKRRMSGFVSWAAPNFSTSYEIAATGTTRASRTIRSTTRFVRGTNAKRTIATTTTKSRNAVPQRGCAVGYGSMRSGVRGSPCSNAWMVMCSAPWYANTRRMSGI